MYQVLLRVGQDESGDLTRGRSEIREVSVGGWEGKAKAMRGVG